LKQAIFLFLLCLSLATQAQTARKYSNEFLNIGVDAAAFGMGNSIVASTSDVNSGYWNPAGLLNLKNQEIALMHASYFANIANYDYAAFAMPLDEKSAVALSVIRFGVDDILNTTKLLDENGQPNYSNISTFSAADYAVTFSYARALPIEGLNFGVNAKVIHRIIGDFASSWGFGFDAGLQYQKNQWRFGAMARDITTTFNTWNINKEKFADIQGAVDGENQEMPETTELTLPKLQLGVARTFHFNENFSLLSEVNFNMRFAQTNDLISTSFMSMTPSAGFQFDYINLIYVRTGVGNFQNILELDGNEKIGFQPNIGIGFHYKGIQVDYALTDIGDQSAALYSNIFSLKVDLSIFKK
jgi:hypothetical protein